MAKFSQFRETRNQNVGSIFNIMQNMNDFFKNYTELFIFGTRCSSNLQNCTVYTVQYKYIDFNNCSFVPKKGLQLTAYSLQLTSQPLTAYSSPLSTPQTAAPSFFIAHHSPAQLLSLLTHPSSLTPYRSPLITHPS